MVKSFRHKGLRRFYETGSSAGIQPSHKNRLRLQLVALDTASLIEDIEYPRLQTAPPQGRTQKYLGDFSQWQLAFNV